MSKPKKILVVDDDKMNLKVAEFILKQHGYSVLKATSGVDCICALATEQVDLILLDIAMPEMDGFETIKLLKEDPDTAKIPVIFLTASADRDSVIEASTHNVAGYIVKPFMPEDLFQRVYDIVGD